MQSGNALPPSNALGGFMVPGAASSDLAPCRVVQRCLFYTDALDNELIKKKKPLIASSHLIGIITSKDRLPLSPECVLEATGGRKRANSPTAKITRCPHCSPSALPPPISAPPTPLGSESVRGWGSSAPPGAQGRWKDSLSAEGLFAFRRTEQKILNGSK